MTENNPLHLTPTELERAARTRGIIIGTRGSGRRFWHTPQEGDMQSLALDYIALLERHGYRFRRPDVDQFTKEQKTQQAIAFILSQDASGECTLSGQARRMLESLSNE